MDDRDAPPPVVTPSTCPFCAGTDVGTTDRTVSASSYWRCAGCGQIWNAGRFRGTRVPPSSRWRFPGRS